MQVGNDRNPWFALQVHARREKTVADLLRFRGCDPFLPLHMERRRWSDRVKKVEAPLFPGYLFCRLSDRNQAAALFTHGVIRILGSGCNPIPVEEDEMAAIHRLTQAGVSSSPWPFLQVGKKVRVEQGSLQGLEGILVDCKGQHRLVISVTLLQRSLALEVERDWVSLVN